MIKSGGGGIGVLLEVHNGGKKNPLEIHEVSPRAFNGGPEWFELYNPSDFAEELSGWSFESEKNSVTKSLLLTDGVMTGGALRCLQVTPPAKNQEMPLRLST